MQATDIAQHIPLQSALYCLKMLPGHTKRRSSSVVEQLTADQQVIGSNPMVDSLTFKFWVSSLSTASTDNPAARVFLRSVLCLRVRLERIGSEQFALGKTIFQKCLDSDQKVVRLVWDPLSIWFGTW